MYFELFSLASINTFPVQVNQTKKEEKSLIIDITFILDTEAY